MDCELLAGRDRLHVEPRHQEQTDRAYVLEQLLDATELTTKESRDRHGFSNGPCEKLLNTEINDGMDCVVIDIETDNLPFLIDGEKSEVPLRFTMSSINHTKLRVTYDVERLD